MIRSNTTTILIFNNSNYPNLSLKQYFYPVNPCNSEAFHYTNRCVEDWVHSHQDQVFFFLSKIKTYWTKHTGVVLTILNSKETLHVSVRLLCCRHWKLTFLDFSKGKFFGRVWRNSLVFREAWRPCKLAETQAGSAARVAAKVMLQDPLGRTLLAPLLLPPLSWPPPGTWVLLLALGDASWMNFKLPCFFLSLVHNSQWQAGSPDLAMPGSPTLCVSGRER